MVGVLHTTVRMKPRRLALGYTEVTFTEPTPLGPAGAAAPGHEFHASKLDPCPTASSACTGIEQRGAAGRAEGYLVGRTLMSYIDVHFGSNQELPQVFVAECE